MTTLSVDEFQKSKIIVDKLCQQNCNEYEKRINSEGFEITSLTFEFGKICLNANSDEAVRSYINYRIKKRGSVEEQLDFSLENIFVKRPESVLIGISRQDSVTKILLLSGLAWGFVNNRAYGVNDPYFDNPNKAMTVYSNPPKAILDSLNYRNIYFSLNPIIKKIYPKYKNHIEYVLTEVLETIRLNEQLKKKLKK